MTNFQTPRGTRDFLPEDMMKRQFILDTARSVFEKWGFDPLETPAFEEFELLTAKSGAAIKDEIYYFKDKSDRELGLRFDFTVPMCRVVASNPDLPKPFRRYQIGPVWRYDRPGAGRYREFCQADIDIAGAAGVDADIETVACACDVLQKLGVSNFSVRVNNRKIINSFLKLLATDKPLEIMRAIDKFEKIGKEGVREELKSKGIDDGIIESVFNFMCSPDLKNVEKLIRGDAKGVEGVKELQLLVDGLERFGFSAVVDMSMVRGLEYYTGNVFEIVQENSLTITAGGRYDNMIEAFGGKPTPAVGISLGVDRIANLIQLDFGKTKVNVYVANVNEKTKNECIKIVKELRDNGLKVEYDVMGRPLAKQLEYVNSKGIKFSIVVGENELKNGTIKLRNMSSGNEKEIELKNLKRVVDIVNSE